MIKNVGFDIFCKFGKKDKYYARLDNMTFDISEEGEENGNDHQGEYFDLNSLNNMQSNIKWEFTIRYDVNNIM